MSTPEQIGQMIVAGIVVALLLVILGSLTVASVVIAHRLVKNKFDTDAINRIKGGFAQFGKYEGGVYGSNMKYASELSDSTSDTRHSLMNRDGFTSRDMTSSATWPPSDENTAYSQDLAKSLLSEAA
jgi:hypothetical protein